MSKVPVLAGVLVFACALPAVAQVSKEQLAKESEIKARSPYTIMRAAIPALTLRDYNAMVRKQAKEELATAQAAAALASRQAPAPSTGSSSKPAPTFTPFSSSLTPTQEGFHFTPFNTGVPGNSTKIEPFTIHDPNEPHNQSTLRTNTTSGDFGFHFRNELSGTEREIGSFSLDDPSGATQCIKVPLGAFVGTRCF